MVLEEAAMGELMSGVGGYAPIRHDVPRAAASHPSAYEAARAAFTWHQARA